MNNYEKLRGLVIDMLADPTYPTRSEHFFKLRECLAGDSDFVRARNVMREALETDEALWQAYEANVAMLLHDGFNKADFTTPLVRNGAAGAILMLIFGFNEKSGKG